MDHQPPQLLPVVGLVDLMVMEPQLREIPQAVEEHLIQPPQVVLVGVAHPVFHRPQETTVKTVEDLEADALLGILMEPRAAAQCVVALVEDLVLLSYQSMERTVVTADDLDLGLPLWATEELEERVA